MANPTSVVNLDRALEKIGEQTAASTSELDRLGENIDSSNPTALIQFQMKMNKWTIQTEFQSTFIKLIRDVCRSIVQKAG